MLHKETLRTSISHTLIETQLVPLVGSLPTTRIHAPIYSSLHPRPSLIEICNHPVYRILDQRNIDGFLESEASKVQPIGVRHIDRSFLQFDGPLRFG